jgi:hypothetical protein
MDPQRGGIVRFIALHKTPDDVFLSFLVVRTISQLL